MKTYQEFLEEGKRKEYNKELERVKKEVKPQIAAGNPIIDYGGDDLKPGSAGLQARLDYMEKQRKKGLEKMKKAFKKQSNDND
jgi:hypothetical protein